MLRFYAGGGAQGMVIAPLFILIVELLNSAIELGFL